MQPPTVFQVLNQLITDPVNLLLRRWNWKSAIFSSSSRAIVFFMANLSAGWSSAAGAGGAELIYRILTAGFYGALTQSFRAAEPVWTANVTVMILLPLLQHSIEFVIHATRGTPNLAASITASVCCTAISTLFNLYAMRRGALVVGSGAGSITDDLKRMPRLIGGFAAAGPLAIWRMMRPSAARPLGQPTPAG